MTPTHELSIEEQLLAMRAGSSYRIPVKLREFTVHLRPLTIDESNEVEAEVRAQLKALPEDAQHSLKEHTIRAKETLWRSSSSSPGVQDCKLTPKVLGLMTNDELQALFKQYISVCDKVNPMLEEMPKERLDAILEHLKKNTPPQEVRSQLIGLSFSDLVSVAGALLTTGD